MKYLVIGATGNIGSRVAQRLIARGERPSVFVRSAKKATALFGDQVDIHVGDLETPRSSLAAALAGCEGVFLVSDGPDLATQIARSRSLRRSAEVRHVFVKLSTLDVHTGVGTGPALRAGAASGRPDTSSDRRGSFGWPRLWRRSTT